jgi:hypothetical protein
MNQETKDTENTTKKQKDGRNQEWKIKRHKTRKTQQRN